MPEVTFRNVRGMKLEHDALIQLGVAGIKSGDVDGRPFKVGYECSTSGNWRVVGLWSDFGVMDAVELRPIAYKMFVGWMDYMDCTVVRISAKCWHSVLFRRSPSHVQI